MARVSDFEKKYRKSINKKYKYNQLCRDCRRRLHTDVIEKKCPYCGSKRMSRTKSGMG